jgi:hypothetical protein
MPSPKSSHGSQLASAPNVAKSTDFTADYNLNQIRPLADSARIVVLDAVAEEREREMSSVWMVALINGTILMSEGPMNTMDLEQCKAHIISNQKQLSELIATAYSADAKKIQLKCVESEKDPWNRSTNIPPFIKY